LTNFPRLSYYLLQGTRRLRWNEKKIRKYQNKQVRRVVKNASDNVPFYRRMFKSAGVYPEEIKTVDDLKRLPIVRKTDIKKIPETENISKEFNVRNLRVVKTGGSTGEPLSIYLSKKEDDWRKSIYLRANISCGQRPRDRWVALTEAEHALETTSLQHRLRIFAQEVVPVVWKPRDQLKTVERIRPDVLDGFSNSLLLLAIEAERKGNSSIQPRIIFGSAELIDLHSRKYLEEVFGAPFYDQFGCTEVDRSAWQCPERIGYHMDVDSVLIQFLDRNGEEVAPGERGEIVYTSLFNYAMPFIRYGTQDLGVPVSDSCPCGIKLPLMKAVEGRSNSFLVFPDKHIVSPMSFIEILQAFRFVKEISQYRVVQKTNDLIEIYIKKTLDDVNEQSLTRTLLTNLSEGLPKVENVDVSKIKFEVKFVNDLPLTQRGKLNVIVSQVQSNLVNSE